MTPDEFQTLIYTESDNDNDSPPSISGQKGLDILIKHFLGKDWYSAGLIHTGQVNYEAVYEILKKYPHKRMNIFEFIDKRKKTKC